MIQLGLNERRKKRYSEDPQYRAHVVDEKRRRWRARRYATGDFTLKDCTKRKAMAHVYGRKRQIHTTKGLVTVLTYNTPELAALLGYHTDVLRKWQRLDKFPRGPYATEDGSYRPPIGVFSQAQALALLEVMGQHQQRSQNLYDSDRDTIAKLFAATGQRAPKHTNTHGTRTTTRKTKQSSALPRTAQTTGTRKKPGRR